MIEQERGHLDADDVAALTKFKEKRAERIALETQKSQAEQAEFTNKLSFLKWSKEKNAFDNAADSEMVTPETLISEHGVTTESEILAQDENRKKEALSSQKGFRRLGAYDSSLQMFVEAAQEPDLKKLDFLRWLAENKQIEHRIAGPSSGPIADAKAAIPELPLAVASDKPTALAVQGDLFIAETSAKELPGSDGLQPA